MPERIPQSVAKRVAFKAYLTGTTTPATSKTIAITISKNGAAYGNPSAGATSATEIASGSYYVDLSVTDTGTLGPLMLLGTAAAIDNVDVVFEVANAHNAGFDGVPSAAAQATGGLPTVNSSGDIHGVAGNIGGNVAGNLSGNVAGSVASVTAAITLPSIPANWITTAGITDGAITDPKIAVPAETAGRPTGILGMIRRFFEWGSNKRTRDTGSGTVLLRNAADNATLETQTQSTVGTLDTQTKGV